MKRVYLIVFIVSTLVGLIFMLPAKLIIPQGHYVTQGRYVMIGRVGGSIWSGRLVLQSQARQVSVLVDWKVNAFCLIKMSACLDIKAQTLSSGGQASELLVGLDVPLRTALASNVCSASGEVSLVARERISPALIKMFVPELQSAEQDIVLSDLKVTLDLGEGVITHASGSADIQEGVIEYRFQNQIVSQSLSRLSGVVENDDDGMLFALSDNNGERYLSVGAPKSKETLSLVVYDAFASAFGAPKLAGQSRNQPRVEISQKIKDLLCAQSEENSAG